MLKSLLIITATVLLTAPFVAPQTPKPEPQILPLQCSHGDCPLLKGVPQTAGMRSGFVHLLPGETVGWHTTGASEESLVILHGQGEVMIEGQVSIPFTAPIMVYVPSATRHNVKNTGMEPLEYVYVVAPAKE